jgi:hypothetical protein
MSGGLPEDQGIAQLPADNMKGMAGGGIIAFEEGGEVPRFQNQGLVYAPYGAQAKTAQPTEAEIAEFNRQRQQGFMGNLSDFLGKIRSSLPSFDAPQLKPTVVKETFVPNADTTTTTTQTSPLVNKEQGVVDKAIADKQAQDEAVAKGQKLPPEPGLPSVNSYIKQYEMNLPKKEEAQNEETFMNKRSEPMKEYFSKANAGIEKEGARLKSDKEQDFYMSLIQGGLAAASESGPNALQNISKGLAVGAGSYKDALKDFRKATQENSRMEMDLMKAKAADKKGDMDAFQKHTESVAERNGKIDQLKASGVASLLGHEMSAKATLGAAKYGRDSMNDYRNQSQVENIRKNIDAKLGDDPKYKFSASARALEVERRLQLELQRYPNLVGYAGTPTTGGASGATNQGWGQATVVK